MQVPWDSPCCNACVIKTIAAPVAWLPSTLFVVCTVSAQLVRAVDLSAHHAELAPLQARAVRFGVLRGYA
jgi:hypothetical protein